MENKSTTFYYLHYLRVFACFAVILLHYSGAYKYRFGIDTFDLGIFFFTITRWSVPIFLMISGALLLGKNIDIITFYKKRFLRILPPFIFWTIIYLFFKNTLKINDIISLIFVEGASFHFWYVYLIIGVMLFLPFLTSWSEKRDKKSLIIFILLWFYWLIIPNRYKEYSTGIDFTYFSSYIGYLVLGYYLHIKNVKRYDLIVGLILFLIGFLYSYYATIQISYKFEKAVEINQRYLSWNVVLMSTGVFLLFKKIKKEIFFKIIREISKYSFGIYLCHILIRDTLVKNYFNFLNFDVYSFLIIKSIIVLFISYIIVKLINYIPIIGKYISG